MDQALLDTIPTTLTFKDGDKEVSYREHPIVKEAPDFATLAKIAVDASREVGARIPLRIDKTNVTEVEKWKKDHLGKFYDAGVLSRPPTSPDEYSDVVKRPETIPDGWGWNQDYEKEFKTIAHEFGIPKAAIPKLLALHEKTLTGASQTLNTSMEVGVAALKAEHGDKYEEHREAAKRLTDYIFKTPEELTFFESLGLGNHPAFLSVIMRLAPLAQADSSFFTSQGSTGAVAGAMTQEEILAEHAKVMNDKNHLHHVGYMRNEKAAMDYVDSLYQKGPNAGKKVEIT